MRFLLFLGFVILIIASFQLLPPAPAPVPVAPSAPTLTKPLIRATDPQKGNAGAPIVLVEFGDFACPSCKAFQPTLESVIAKFPEKILKVWKDFPLPIHPLALPAHIAAACANEQRKFWEYHDRLFALPSLANADYDALAKELELDSARFTACRNDATIQARVSESFAEGRLLDVDQTPYLFINDQRLPGTTNSATLEKTITDFLK